MDATEEKFKALEINTRLEEFYTKFSTNTSFLSPDRAEQLARFERIFIELERRLKTADTSNTPYEIFDRIIAILDSTNERLSKLRIEANEDKITEYVVDIANTSDRLLILFPSINVTQDYKAILGNSNATLEETKNSLAKVKEYEGLSAKAYNETLEHNTDSIKLSEQLATHLLIGDYQKRAEKEKIEADKWTDWTWKISITLIILIVVFFIAQVILISYEKFTIALLSSKLVLAATLGLLAKWASKRANRHLMEEAKYHRLAVNINTVKGFIASLEPQAKDVVMSAVALKIFTDISGNESPTEFEGLNLADFVKNFLSKEK